MVLQYVGVQMRGQLGRKQAAKTRQPRRGQEDVESRAIERVASRYQPLIGSRLSEPQDSHQWCGDRGTRMCLLARAVRFRSDAARDRA